MSLINNASLLCYTINRGKNDLSNKLSWSTIVYLINMDGY